MDSTQNLPDTLPQEFHKFFPDIDATKLKPRHDFMLIISRLFDKGEATEVRWVRRSFPENLIIKTIKEWPDFEPMTITFWANYFNIPLNETKGYDPSKKQIRRGSGLWPYSQH